MNAIKLYLLLSIAILTLNLSSCSNLGSVTLPPDRLAYNQSLTNSDEQQVLLNIVRLRYTDPPFFLTVNNIVSQFNFGSNYSVNVANSGSPPALLGTGNAAYSYSEAPTITYTPMQGEEFVNKLLTPVSLSVVYMSLRSGWSLHHCARLIFQRFGTVSNAVLASRLVSARMPEYKAFMRIMDMFRHLQDDNNLLIRKDLIDNEFAIRLTIKSFKRVSPADRAILAHYHVTAKSPDLWLTSSVYPGKNQVYIETRTVMSLLNYLSKGVDVPACDVANHQVKMTYYPNGAVFDWRTITRYIIRIRSSKAKPNNAFVAVAYRGSWFYVPENDFASKETLNLLAIIMGIYQTKVPTNFPVFTIS